VATIRVGLPGLPDRSSPEAAVAWVRAAGFDAAELDFEGGFWMDKPFAARLGAAARDADVALSVHAPIAAFVGHVEAQKTKRAFGMLDHTAGLAALCGAEVVVVHPGFLLGRTREEAIDAVAAHLGELRERLEAKGRAVPLGIEVMGRVRDLGSAEDVFAIAERVPWVRPVLDFAHMHATSDGAYLGVEPFAEALERADALLEPGAPFHVHFSDVAFANRNETRHLPYGEGTLRAEPLRAALERFARPATVISEAPDDASHQAIRTILVGADAAPASA
jgi:deoxyribonuclease-4